MKTLLSSSVKTMRCSKCGRRKPRGLKHFPPRAKGSTFLSSWCRSCVVINSRRWARKNPARVAQLRKQQYAKNPRPAIEAAKRWNMAHASYLSGVAKTPRRRRMAKNALFKRKYGISLSAVLRLKRTQQYRCAICRKKRPLAVDHEHRCGKVRALLCHNCNVALGLLGESIKIFLAAAAYLRRHS